MSIYLDCQVGVMTLLGFLVNLVMLMIVIFPLERLDVLGTYAIPQGLFQLYKSLLRTSLLPVRVWMLFHHGVPQMNSYVHTCGLYQTCSRRAALEKREIYLIFITYFTLFTAPRPSFPSLRET